MKIKKEVDYYGTIHYFNEKNQHHREDGPAIEYSNGYKSWRQYGKLHRLDGPAIISNTGVESWYLNGKQILVFSQEEFERYLRLTAFI